MKIYDAIVWTEKAILVLIAGFTVYAVALEMLTILVARSVKLTDLLLLFIYAEVLGMVAAFYKNRRIPITIPIFIAITARISGDQLFVAVENSGPWVEQPLRPLSGSQSHGTGLANLRRRLEVIYRGRAEMVIEHDRQRVGVTVRIPVEQAA